MTRIWHIINDQWNANHDVGNEIIYIEALYRVYLYIYNYLYRGFKMFNGTYILVRGDIVTTTHDNQNPVAFESCGSFIKCITKIDGTAVDDAEHLDLVMPTNNLTEYSSNYSETTGSLWFYLKDEANNFNADIANNNNFKF